MLSPTQSRFHAVRLRFENHVPSSPFNAFLWELFLFTFKQAWACLFAGLLLALLLLTKWFWPAQTPVHFWISRYDFLFLAALTIQFLLLALRMETVREAKIILLFHLVGTAMELFKTSVGSWSYPELSTTHTLFHLGHVPLFSGFMYASIGSFMARTARILDLRYTRYPSRLVTALLGVLIYANFFTHHYLPDIRLVLFAFVAIAYGPTTIYYRPYQSLRQMPLLLGFALVTLFIFAAENIGTFATAWLYPNQAHGWQLVQAGKYGSWFPLMIISVILVSLAHPPRQPD